MKSTNIADFKNHLGQFMALVEGGEEIEIRKRNVPFARVVPLHQPKKNQTKLGSDAGSVVIKADLTEPAISETDWTMLREEP